MVYITVVLKEKPILNRRFVRLKAMQNLYAFHVCKQANYQWALAQIRDAFAPDVFADPPLNKEQQAAEQEKALALFAALVALDQAVISKQQEYSDKVQTVVQQVRTQYEQELAKDLKKLKSSWPATLASIQQTCLLVLALLIEWRKVAQQQFERTKFTKQQGPNWGLGLANNRILESLQANNSFAQLIQQHHISWSKHTDLVINWYNQFIKPQFSPPNTPEQLPNQIQEIKFLETLVQAVIFEEKVIQDFLGETELSWVANKSIIKKWVLQALAILQENTQENTNFELFKITSEWETAGTLYTSLINHSLTQDQAFEKIIQEHTKNWSINRIVLLDKVIIKLALSEIIYLTSIPVKVSMNEYMDLSKVYSTPKSSYFINGVLDAVAKTR